MTPLDAATARLGIAFRDPQLLMRALTHRSYLNEVPEHPVTHNERLEFLGDAIIDFLVGEHLFLKLPDVPEGELSALRAALVSTAGLADFGRALRLGELMFMGKGEEASGGREREALLADAFEAVVAAIYLDQGMEATAAWMQRFIEPAVEALLADRSRARDAKSQLQERAQAQLGLTPTYEVIAESGPDHARHFTMQVRIGTAIYGTGEGRSKQRAAQAAAEDALRYLDGDGPVPT